VHKAGYNSNGKIAPQEHLLLVEKQTLLFSERSVYFAASKRSAGSALKVACRFLHGKQMTAYEQIRIRDVVVDCFSDLGLCRILCCAVLCHSEVMISSLFLMSHALCNVIHIITSSSACVICIFDCLFVICF